MDVMGQNQISQWPPTAKLFVALFTTLMLAVCLWAVWIYTAERGEVDEDNLPAYMIDEAEEAVESEIESIAADDEAVRAPVWDVEHHGEDEPFDSSEIDSMMIEAGYDAEDYEPGYADETENRPAEEDDRFKDNLGLAHVHVNGQTLLFFALGAVFLFTSVSRKSKKLVLWAFALTIVLHTVGLTGEGYHWIYDDMLAISGVLMLLLIAYMCFMIYVDLGRKRKVTE